MGTDRRTDVEMWSRWLSVHSAIIIVVGWRRRVVHRERINRKVWKTLLHVQLILSWLWLRKPPSKSHSIRFWLCWCFSCMHWADQQPPNPDDDRDWNFSFVLCRTIRSLSELRLDSCEWTVCVNYLVEYIQGWSIRTFDGHERNRQAGSMRSRRSSFSTRSILLHILCRSKHGLVEGWTRVLEIYSNLNGNLLTVHTVNYTNGDADYNVAKSSKW